MAKLPDTLILGPADEARRLWLGALEALEDAAVDLVSLCEALDLGLRAAEILIVSRLQPADDRFPATIGLLLERPHPEVDVERDALRVPPSLDFTAALDLLSWEDLDCVGPGLHHGWEDRRSACRRVRAAAQEIVGVTLDADQRQALLLLAAYRNRLFRQPPPVEVKPPAILAAFATLVGLIESLQPPRPA